MECMRVHPCVHMVSWAGWGGVGECYRTLDCNGICNRLGKQGGGDRMKGEEGEGREIPNSGLYYILAKKKINI